MEQNFDGLFVGMSSENGSVNKFYWKGKLCLNWSKKGDKLRQREKTRTLNVKSVVVEWCKNVEVVEGRSASFIFFPGSRHRGLGHASAMMLDSQKLENLEHAKTDT